MEIDNDQHHPKDEDHSLDDNDVSKADFITSLSNPLRDYAEKCFSPNENEDSIAAITLSGQEQQQQQQRLDEFEISIRSHLLILIEQLLTDGGNKSNSNHDEADEAETAALKTLLRYLKDVSLLCLHISMQQATNNTSTTTTTTAIKKLPYLLIEDTIDSLPLPLIQRVWSSKVYPTLSISSYIIVSSSSSNNHHSILTSPHLFIPLSKFILLRICNKILRLLSNRTVHSNFAGSIMILLAQVFPLSERRIMKMGVE